MRQEKEPCKLYNQQGEKMKLFLDTADVAQIKKWAATGLIDGVTTNPTHLSKQQQSPQEIIRTICTLLPDGDISVEVTHRDPHQVYEQAKKIAQLAPNIIVKIPCHIHYVPIIKKLVEEDIPLNITLIFSVAQGLMMANLGVTYISPFVGRLNDAGGNGVELVEELQNLCEVYDYDTEVLAASLRTVEHLEEVALCGVDAATIPVEIFEKAFAHSLSEKGIDQFLADWQKLGITQFP